MLVTNRVQWEVTRIVRAYRHRWTGTETFHRDGKQQLGMGDCQLRDSQGQTRHMYLVMLAYSLLMQQLRQGHAYEWAFEKLTTIGQACRAILRETLRDPRFVTSMALWRIVSRGYGRFDEARFAKAFADAGLELVRCQGALSGLGMFGIGRKS